MSTPAAHHDALHSQATNEDAASSEGQPDGASGMVSVVGRRRGVRDLADGTLRVIVEVGAKERKTVFEHFAEPNMPIAMQLLGERAEPVRCTKRSFSTVGREALQLTLDIDADSRTAFLKHFYDFDAEIVLAPLRCADALNDRRKAAAQTQRRRLGALEALARSWPREARFREWLAHEVGRDMDEGAAVAWIKDRCGVSKRSEIDLVPEARRCFDQEFRVPYREHLVRIGAS